MRNKKTLTFVFYLLFSSSISAEQWEWLLEEQALAAVKLTSEQTSLIKYCKPCQGKPTEITVRKISAERMNDGSYRFMLDDWGINSHTFDFRYRWQLGSSYLEPHLRYYMQSEADFYKRYITESEYNSGNPTLTEATADYRLGDLDGMTVGLKYGHKLDNETEFNMRVEYYLQSSTGDDGFGLLKDQDLYPDTKALIFQVGYSF